MARRTLSGSRSAQERLRQAAEGGDSHMSGMQRSQVLGVTRLESVGGGLGLDGPERPPGRVLPSGGSLAAVVLSYGLRQDPLPAVALPAPGGFGDWSGARVVEPGDPVNHAHGPEPGQASNGRALCRWFRHDTRPGSGRPLEHPRAPRMKPKMVRAICCAIPQGKWRNNGSAANPNAISGAAAPVRASAWSPAYGGSRSAQSERAGREC